LGLATVYGIVKQHCGFIRVESEPGQGCTSHIFLPVAKDPKNSNYNKVVLEDQPVRGGNETILIAEDHDGIREMATEVLESLGYHILIARGGEEAVAVFSAHRDSISLVLLDAIMPRRSGPEIYASIEALKSGVSVVFATGYADDTNAIAGIVERGIAVLKKPYSPRTLCRKVREVLDLATAARLSRS
jgi:response regulator RpfG family c-di-GMP phosphodiesterase